MVGSAGRTSEGVDVLGDDGVLLGAPDPAQPAAPGLDAEHDVLARR